MSFKEQVREDIHGVFLNLEEFGEKRTIRYDGEVYEDVPVVVSEHRQTERELPTREDRATGLYHLVTRVNAALADIGGKLPERGCPLWMSLRQGGEFLQKYYINLSKLEEGLVIMELKAVDE